MPATVVNLRPNPHEPGIDRRGYDSIVVRVDNSKNKLVPGTSVNVHPVSSGVSRPRSSGEKAEVMRCLLHADKCCRVF